MIRWFLNLFRPRRTEPTPIPEPTVAAQVDRVVRRSPSRDMVAEVPAPAPRVLREPDLVPERTADAVRVDLDGADGAATPASEDEPEPVADASPPVPAEEPRVEVDVPSFEIELADYSHVEFVNPDHGFAPPPQRAQPARRSRRRTPLGASLVRELVREFEEMSPCLEAAFAGETVSIDLPTSDAQDGYLVGALTDSFVIAQGEHSGETRTLRHALSGAQVSDERTADALDRLELVRLAAMAVEGLHRADVVFSTLDLDSFAFCLDGRPQVALADGGLVRRLGGEFLADPTATRGLDDDRADFAVLAATLLSDGGSDVPDEVPGLSMQGARRLQALCDRVAGASGTRAPVSVWLEVLGR